MVVPGAVRKAVIPAAGLGTRFLPATKAVPKELLPVVDVPAIEFVVAEAARAGLCDVLLITGAGKDALADHFDEPSAALVEALEAKGDFDRLAAVRRSASLALVHTVRQGQPLGLGHAVLQAAAHVGDEAFAVLLGDDLIDERDLLLEEMLDVRQRYGGSVVALMEVPREQSSLYGIASVTDSGDGSPRAPLVHDLVEKPDPRHAPSTLAVLGRYVLDPEIFDVLRTTEPGRGGEIQLTDALRSLAAAGRVRGVVFEGRRYDTGDRLDYLRTVVRLACEREDLGPAFREWLADFAQGLAP
jgi:UTP--glucose-1-phosphate uridylyltransferase